MPQILGEYLDRVCTVEIRPGVSNIPRGRTHRLYQAARDKFREPLTYLAAKMLRSRVAAGDNVFIVTGAGGPPLLPVGEVDGYLGAAAIARAAILGLKATPILIGEEHCWQPLYATCRGAEINMSRPNGEPTALSALFEPLPLGHEACQERARGLLNHYKPKVVLAIERLSPNRKEVIHGATGINYDAVHAKAQYLFDQAKDRGAATIGIGDGGNEIGFGVIPEAVEEIVPAGAKCRCPCAGGTAARVATDVLVVAAISNWGGYGVVANLAFTLKKPSLMITPDTAERMLRNCVEAGALDGVFARPTLSDDGVPLEATRACVAMLKTLVDIGLTEIDSPGH